MTNFKVKYRNLLNGALEHLRTAERDLTALLESPEFDESTFENIADEVNLAGVKLRYVRLELLDDEEVPEHDPADDTLSPDD